MPLYNVKVSVTRTINTEWEHVSPNADSAFETAHAVARQVWPNADNIEVSVEPIKNIDTE